MDRIKTRSKIKNQRSKIRKITFIIFSLVGACCMVFGAFWWRQGWNGKDPANIVISSGSKLWVVAVRPREHRMVEVEVPETTVIHRTKNGTIQARALWQISELEHDPGALALAGTSLLQVPVDTSFRLERWNGARSFGLQSVASRQSLLSIPELLRFLWFIRSLRENDFQSIDLSEMPEVRKMVDPGGTQLFEVDKERLSPQVARWFEILEFREAGLSVSVVSRRDTPGFGADVARQLEHSGLRVVSVANGDKENGIYVRSSSLSRNPIVTHLSSWFHESVSVSDFDERGDILVVL